MGTATARGPAGVGKGARVGECAATVVVTLAYLLAGWCMEETLAGAWPPSVGWGAKPRKGGLPEGGIWRGSAPGLDCRGECPDKVVILEDVPPQGGVPGSALAEELIVAYAGLGTVGSEEAADD